MKKISLFFTLTLFLISISFISQGNALHADDEADKPCKAKVIKCPVSGEVISKDAMTIKTKYKGKTYYFCCEKCQAEFEKNPEKYAKACSCQTMYTCPMKECNYKTDKPGKCPKCGMELEKAKCECDHSKTKTKCAAKKEGEKEEK
jgi:Cu+-exporting ATPase